MSRRSEILEELRQVRERTRALSVELRTIEPHADARAHHAEIISRLRDGASLTEAAKAVGYSYCTVHAVVREYERRTGDRLPRVGIAQRGKRARNLEREAAIVAAYHADGGTFESVGKLYGITRERVRQIIARAEAAAGETPIRHNRRLNGEAHSAFRKRRLWRCPGCGTERKLSPAAWERAQGSQCSSCASRKHLSDALIEEGIARLKTEGDRRGVLYKMALEAGYPPNGTAALKRAIYKALERRGEVAQVWPDGIPHWLARYARDPSVNVKVTEA